MLDKEKEYIGYCPEEGDFLPGNIAEESKDHIVCGVQVKATTYHLVCKKCGAYLSSDIIEKENDINVYNAYKKKVGLLTTDEIKQIRTKRGWSQRTLARFLGIGEKDITRYENGAVQTKSIDRMIRLVDDDLAFERMCVCFNQDLSIKK